MNEGPGDLARLLAWLDARSAGGKQLLFEGGAGRASLALSRQDLHDYPALEGELAKASRVRCARARERSPPSGPGSTRACNVREALAVLAGMGAAVLDLSSSRFRISFLLEESHVPEARRQLHRRLVVDERTAPDVGASPGVRSGGPTRFLGPRFP